MRGPTPAFNFIQANSGNYTGGNNRTVKPDPLTTVVNSRQEKVVTTVTSDHPVVVVQGGDDWLKRDALEVVNQQQDSPFWSWLEQSIQLQVTTCVQNKLESKTVSAFRDEIRVLSLGKSK